MDQVAAFVQGRSTPWADTLSVLADFEPTRTNAVARTTVAPAGTAPATSKRSNALVWRGMFT